MKSRTSPEGDVRTAWDGSGCDRLRASFELGVRGEDEIADALLRVDVRDRAQQRKAAALTIDGVLVRRERDVAPRATAALPDAEADQLQAVERAVGEMQLGIGEFAGRVAFVVRGDLDDHTLTS